MPGQSAGLYTAPTVTFLAFFLLLLTCISVPFAQDIRFFTLVDHHTGGSIRFGLWGYCLSKSIDEYPQCSVPKIGWTFQNIRTLVGLDDSISPISTGILFIHPIAATCVFIVFVVSLALILKSSSQHKLPTKSRRKSSNDHLLPTSIVLAAMVTTIAFAVDIVFIVNVKRRVKEASLPARNMKAYIGAIIWLTAFAALILWIATIMLSVMNKDKSRDERFTDEGASAYGSDVSGRRRDTPAHSMRSTGSQQPSEYSMHSRTVSVSHGDDEDWRSDPISTRRSQLSTPRQGSRTASVSHADDEDWRADSISTRRSQLSISRQGSRSSYDADDRYDSAEDAPQEERSHGFLATCLPCLKRRKDKGVDDREEDIELGEMRDSDTRMDADSLRSSVGDVRSRTDRSSGGFDEERDMSSVRDVSSLDRHSEDPAEEEKSHGFLAACLPCLKRRKDADMDDREEDIELSEMHDSDPRLDTDSLRSSVEDIQSRTIKSSDVFDEERGTSNVRDVSDPDGRSQYSETLSDRGVSNDDGSQYSPPRTPSPSYIDRDGSEGSYASSRRQPSASLSYRKSSSVRSMSTLRSSHGAYSDDDTMIENESPLVSNKGLSTKYPSGSGTSFQSDLGSPGQEFEGTPPFSDRSRSMESHGGEITPVPSPSSVVSQDALETPFSTPVSSRRESYVSEPPVSSSYRSGPLSTYPESGGERDYESQEGSAQVSDRSPEYHESVGETYSAPLSSRLPSEGYDEEPHSAFVSNTPYESAVSNEALESPLSSPVSDGPESYVSEPPVSSNYRSGPLSTYPASTGERDYESGERSTRISDRSPEYHESVGETYSPPLSSRLPSEEYDQDPHSSFVSNAPYESEPIQSSPLSDRERSLSMYESEQPASSVYREEDSAEMGQTPPLSDNEEYDSNIASFSRPLSDNIGSPEDYRSGESVPSTVYPTDEGDGDFEQALSDRPSSALHSSLPRSTLERGYSSPAATDDGSLEFEPEPATPRSSGSDAVLDYEGEDMSRSGESTEHEDEHPLSSWKSSYHSELPSPSSLDPQNSESNLSYESIPATDSEGSAMDYSAEREGASEQLTGSRSEQMSDMGDNDSYMSEPPESSLTSNRSLSTKYPSGSGTPFQSDLGSAGNESGGGTPFSDGSRSMVSYGGEITPVSSPGSVLSQDLSETLLSSPVSGRHESYVSDPPISSSYRSGPLSSYPASSGEQGSEPGQGWTSAQILDRSPEYHESVGGMSSAPLSTRLSSEGYDEEPQPSFASNASYGSAVTNDAMESPLSSPVSDGPESYVSEPPVSSNYRSGPLSTYPASTGERDYESGERSTRISDRSPEYHESVGETYSPPLSSRLPSEEYDQEPHSSFVSNAPYESEPIQSSPLSDRERSLSMYESGQPASSTYREEFSEEVGQTPPLSDNEEEHDSNIASFSHPLSDNIGSAEAYGSGQSVPSTVYPTDDSDGEFERALSDRPSSVVQSSAMERGSSPPAATDEDGLESEPQPSTPPSGESDVDLNYEGEGLSPLTSPSGISTEHHLSSLGSSYNSESHAPSSLDPQTSEPDPATGSAMDYSTEREGDSEQFTGSRSEQVSDIGDNDSYMSEPPESPFASNKGLSTKYPSGSGTTFQSDLGSDGQEFEGSTPFSDGSRSMESYGGEITPVSSPGSVVSQEPLETPVSSTRESYVSEPPGSSSYRSGPLSTYSESGGERDYESGEGSAQLSDRSPEYDESVGGTYSAPLSSRMPSEGYDQEAHSSFASDTPYESEPIQSFPLSDRERSLSMYESGQSPSSVHREDSEEIEQTPLLSDDEYDSKVTSFSRPLSDDRSGQSVPSTAYPTDDNDSDFERAPSDRLSSVIQSSLPGLASERNSLSPAPTDDGILQSELESETPPSSGGDSVLDYEGDEVSPLASLSDMSIGHESEQQLSHPLSNWRSSYDSEPLSPSSPDLQNSETDSSYESGPATDSRGSAMNFSTEREGDSVYFTGSRSEQISDMGDNDSYMSEPRESSLASNRGLSTEYPSGSGTSFRSDLGGTSRELEGTPLSTPFSDGSRSMSSYVDDITPVSSFGAVDSAVSHDSLQSAPASPVSSRRDDDVPEPPLSSTYRSGPLSSYPASTGDRDYESGEGWSSAQTSDRSPEYHESLRQSTSAPLSSRLPSEEYEQEPHSSFGSDTPYESAVSNDALVTPPSSPVSSRHESYVSEPPVSSSYRSGPLSTHPASEGEQDYESGQGLTSAQISNRSPEYHESVGEFSSAPLSSRLPSEEYDQEPHSSFASDAPYESEPIQSAPLSDRQRSLSMYESGQRASSVYRDDGSQEIGQTHLLSDDEEYSSKITSFSRPLSNTTGSLEEHGSGISLPSTVYPTDDSEGEFERATSDEPPSFKQSSLPGLSSEGNDMSTGNEGEDTHSWRSSYHSEPLSPSSPDPQNSESDLGYGPSPATDSQGSAMHYSTEREGGPEDFIGSRSEHMSDMAGNDSYVSEPPGSSLASNNDPLTNYPSGSGTSFQSDLGSDGQGFEGSTPFSDGSRSMASYVGETAPVSSRSGAMDPVVTQDLLQTPLSSPVLDRHESYVSEHPVSSSYTSARLSSYPASAGEQDYESGEGWASSQISDRSPEYHESVGEFSSPPRSSRLPSEGYDQEPYSSFASNVSYESAVSHDSLQTPVSSPVSSRHESYVSDPPMSSTYRSGPLSTYPVSEGERDYESGQGWSSAQISDRSPEYHESLGGTYSAPLSTRIPSEGYDQEPHSSFASNAPYESEPIQSSPLSDRGRSLSTSESEQPASSVYREEDSEEMGQTPPLSDNEGHASSVASFSRPLSSSIGSPEDYRSGQSTVYPTDDSDGEFERALSGRPSSIIQSSLPSSAMERGSLSPAATDDGSLEFEPDPSTTPSGESDAVLDYEGEDMSLSGMSTERPLSSWGSGYDLERLTPSSRDPQTSESDLGYRPSPATDSRGSAVNYSTEREMDSGQFIGSRSEQMSDVAGNDSYMSELPGSTLASNNDPLTNYPSGSGISFPADWDSTRHESEGMRSSDGSRPMASHVDEITPVSSSFGVVDSVVSHESLQTLLSSPVSDRHESYASELLVSSSYRSARLSSPESAGERDYESGEGRTSVQISDRYPEYLESGGGSTSARLSSRLPSEGYDPEPYSSFASNVSYESAVSHDGLQTPVSSPVSSRHESYVSDPPMSSTYRSGPLSSHPAPEGEQDYESGQGWTSAQISDRTPGYHEAVGEFSSPARSSRMPSEGYDQEPYSSFASNAPYESEQVQSAPLSDRERSLSMYESGQPPFSAYRDDDSHEIGQTPLISDDEGYSSNIASFSHPLSDVTGSPEDYRSEQSPSSTLDSDGDFDGALSDRLSSVIQNSLPSSALERGSLLPVFTDDDSLEFEPEPATPPSSRGDSVLEYEGEQVSPLTSLSDMSTSHEGEHPLSSYDSEPLWPSSLDPQNMDSNLSYERSPATDSAMDYSTEREGDSEHFTGARSEQMPDIEEIPRICEYCGGYIYA